MVTHEEPLSERIVYTVAEVLDEEPEDLPPIQRTLSADSLDYLFHREDHPPGAYTVFPYCDLWVVAHSNGNVDVFETYRATSAAEQLPDDVPEPDTDERMVVLHFEDERYTFTGSQLKNLHEIVATTDDTDEAWDEMVEYAREQSGEQAQAD